MLALFSVIAVVLTVCQSSIQVAQQPRSFSIDYEKNQFLKDGKPFRYISGSMHYFRVPREHWQDRFQKMKAAGLNAVQTYADWSQHEPEPGVYDFSGFLDIISFIQLAQQNDLFVIFRPGPYICAERDWGGLPYWLMRENPNITIRTYDPSYVKYVDVWMARLLTMVKPYLYVNGGPIIAVQVENEYGSYYACDWNYMNHLRDFSRYYLGKNVVLFTTDGNADSFLKCGKIQGVYSTVDFGPGSDVNASFHAQRNHEPHGPLVNSEYYTGRLGHWGHPAPELDLDEVIKTLEEMLDMNASVNMYMFHGGTSFGFTNGANIDDSYVPDTTSYDFGGPLSESGEVTELYLRIRDCLAKYSDEPLPPIPAPTPAYAYGKVPMQRLGSLFDLQALIAHAPPIINEDPLTFEALGQAYGFVLYQTVLQNTFIDPSAFAVTEIRDRGYVFIDQTFVGILSRTGNLNSLPITAAKNQVLSILVESQGRVNYGNNLKEFKGLISAPTIGKTVLKNWKMICFPFNNTRQIEKVANLLENTDHGKGMELQTGQETNGIPALYIGNFNLTQNLSEAQDTFLITPGWTRGLAILNGFILGRYWPAMGPQVTLYVPKGVLIYPANNKLILLELQKSPCSVNKGKARKSVKRWQNDCSVEFIDKGILNGTTPLLDLQSNSEHL